MRLTLRPGTLLVWLALAAAARAGKPAAWTEPDKQRLQYAVTVASPRLKSGRPIRVTCHVRNASDRDIDVGGILCTYCAVDNLAITNSHGSPMLRGPHLEVEHDPVRRMLDGGQSASSPVVDLCTVGVSTYWLQTLAHPDTYTLHWRGAKMQFTVLAADRGDPVKYLAAPFYKVANGLHLSFQTDTKSLTLGGQIHFRMVYTNRTDKPIKTNLDSWLHASVGAVDKSQHLGYFEEVRVERLPVPEVFIAPGETRDTRGLFRFVKKERGHCLGTAAGWTIIPRPGTYRLVPPLIPQGEVRVRLDWDE